MKDLIKNGLFKTEDWLAVWIGFLIIGLVLVGVRPQMPTFKWATESEFTAAVAGSKPAVERFVKDVESKGDVKLFVAALALKSTMVLSRPVVPFKVTRRNFLTPSHLF